VTALKEVWVEENRQMHLYLESLDDDQFNSSVPVTDRHGNVSQ